MRKASQGKVKYPLQGIVLAPDMTIPPAFSRRGRQTALLLLCFAAATRAAPWPAGVRPSDASAGLPEEVVRLPPAAAAASAAGKSDRCALLLQSTKYDPACMDKPVRTWPMLVRGAVYGCCLEGMLHAHVVPAHERLFVRLEGCGFCMYSASSIRLPRHPLFSRLLARRSPAPHDPGRHLWPVSSTG